MKELDSFTGARLEDFIRQPLENGLTRGEQMELVRFALAAKRAEGLPGNIYPDISGEITALEKILKWILNLEVPTTGATNRAILLGNTIELLRDCQKPIVATPQLNSPQGWIQCSDHKPERGTDVQVYCSDTHEQFVAFYIGNGEFQYAQHKDTSITCFPSHWMPLPSAPDKAL